MSDATPKYPYLPEGTTVLSVSQITDEVRGTLESNFPSIWIEGELTGMARPASGHLYFSLRDDKSVLKCVMYRGRALRCQAGFEPRDGIQVVAGGSLSVYGSRGEYQLNVERIYPKGGIGAAELALRQLKEKLQVLGYFDPRRKRQPPRFPRSICLITSSTGAAVRDMIEILGRRWPATRIVVVHTRVQGAGAAEEIAAAIQQINRWRAQRKAQVDVMIIGRGGGSAEDLSAFNEEIVAQAVFQSKIPIISAVGHEIDLTIADLVADVRAATPSHAAELAVPDRVEIQGALHGCSGRMREAMLRKCEALRGRLDSLAGRRPLQRPTERLRELERRLDDWSERLTRSGQSRLRLMRHGIEAIAARLESLSPLNVLARGYSLTRTEASPALIRSAEDVHAGDRLITMLHRGRIISRVEATEPPEKPND